MPNHDIESVFVLLSIGSNLGDSNKIISEAVDLLYDSEMLSHIKLSSFYESEPFGFSGQPWFINIAVSGYTTHTVFELIEFIKSIEYLLGRQQRETWHEREIDIDIMLYGNLKLDSKKLTIPHTQMEFRRFVLVPSAEIAGNIIHPVLNKTINTMLEECKDMSIVNLVHNI
jgi:2-amino-4-hydroxy-6-hydroxymethyldihydropteridine diphosphokinase